MNGASDIWASRAKTTHRIKKKSVYKVVEEAIFYKYGDFGVRHLKGQVAGPILARVPPAGLGGKVPCAIKHPK